MTQSSQDSALQERLNAAAAGAVVRIEKPGEYHGPFVITKPITFEGRGRLTPLWRTSGVVLVVAAPNVILRDISVETVHPVNTNGLPLIVHLDAAYAPTFQNTISANEESYLMTERNFIHLASLRAAQKLTLPFELEANFPFNQLDKLPPYLALDEPRNNRHGARAFWLNVNVPNEDGYIVDSLTMTGDGGASGQYLIHARVTDEAAPDIRYMFKVVRSPGRIRNIYALAGMLELSEEQISLIVGGQVSRGRSLYIFTDDRGGDQFIWLPFQSIRHSVTYDDIRLQGWKRYPLQAGKRLGLKQGDLEIEITPVKDVTLEVSPGGVDFGELTQVNKQIRVEIKNNQNLIQRGLGLIKRQVTIKPLVDWLTVSAGSLKLDRGGAELLVGVNANILNKPAGETIFEPSALAIFDDNDIFFMPVRIQVKLPEYDLVLEQPVLTFLTKDNSPIYAGEVPALQAVGMFVNNGRTPASIEVINKPDWIVLNQEIVTPIRPGEKMPFAALIVPEKANLTLSPEKSEIKDAVQLRCREDGKVFNIALKIALMPPRLPNIRIENAQAAPRMLNLDALERKEIRKGENAYDQVYRRVRLKNYGMVEGRYRFSSSHPAVIYLDSQPIGGRSETRELSGNLAPGADTSVGVLYGAHIFRNEVEGSTVNIDIQVETGKDQSNYTVTATSVIPVNIVRLVPVVTLSKQIITLARCIQGQDFQFKDTVTVQNTGNDLLEGELVIHPQYQSYFRVTPTRELRLPVGDSTSFTIETTRSFSSMPPGVYNVPDLVTVQRADLNKNAPKRMTQLAVLGATWVIERPDPLPFLHTRSLYFSRAEIGFEDRQSVLVNEQPLIRELVIGNYGYAPYVFRFELNTPWLEAPIAQGTSIEIPPQKVLRLPLTVNDRIAKYEVGAVQNKQGIILQSQVKGAPSYTIPVRILVEHLGTSVNAQPPIVQLGAITAGQMLPEKYMNADFFLSNTGRTDWHIVDAGTQYNYVVFDHMPNIVPKMSQTSPITVKWNDVYPAPKVDRVTQSEDLITLRDANEQTVTVRVQYDIHPTQIKMKPAKLELQLSPSFASRSFGARRPQSETRLVIENLGNAPFWLKQLNPLVGDGIPGNLVLPVGLRLDPSVEDGIVIKSGETQEFRLYAPKPEDVGDGVFPILLHMPDTGEILRTFVEIRS